MCGFWCMNVRSTLSGVLMYHVVFGPNVERRLFQYFDLKRSSQQYPSSGCMLRFVVEATLGGGGGSALGVLTLGSFGAFGGFGGFGGLGGFGAFDDFFFLGATKHWSLLLVKTPEFVMLTDDPTE